jgi:hypothetical protein
VDDRERAVAKGEGVGQAQVERRGFVAQGKLVSGETLFLQQPLFL